MNKESAISLVMGTWGFVCGAMYTHTREFWVFIVYSIGIVILRYMIDALARR